jgi:hypothetical protein
MRTRAHISAQAEADAKRKVAEKAAAEKELAAEEVVTSKAVGKKAATPVGQTLDLEQGLGGGFWRQEEEEGDRGVQTTSIRLLRHLASTC